MAVVFEARHLASNRPVALKVLRNGAHRGDEAQRLLREEIRATARLDHPNVVRVLDLGVVSDPVTIEDVDIQPGEDFLVMELVGAGALDRVLPLDWPQARDLLLHVLSALAHAHACGVIHRDLKPANILLERTDHGLLPKVADFGLARLDPETRTDTQESLRGTPAYMAPEQILTQVRDHGPWTDLYAVGCMAYEFVAGRPPFEGQHFLDTLRRHLEQEMPPLPSNAPRPDGFETWVGRLLAKNPRHRFRHAADAAHGLLRISERSASDIGKARISEETVRTEHATEVDTIALPTLPLFDAKTLELTGIATDLEEPSAPAKSMRREAPPMPTTWRPTAPAAGLSRTGVALFELRPTPLFDRHDEQRILWDLLLEVRETSSPRCALLVGAPGAGKTKLAEWLALAADEVGAASVLRAAHQPNGGPFHGIADMFRRFFALGGMSQESARARVQAWMQEVEHPGAEQAGVRLFDWLMHSRAPAAGEVLELAHRVTQLLSEHRPVVVILDDLEYGRDTIIAALRFLESARLPVLLVGTATQTRSVPEADVAELLEKLARHRRTTALKLQPIAIQTQDDLLREFFGLSPEAAISILERSDGNLDFALHLVRDAIDCGNLVPTDEGWSLPSHAQVTLPEDVQTVLHERLQRFVDADPATSADVVRALTAAAVLGTRFDDGEWGLLCSFAGVGVRQELLDRALDRGILMRDGAGWAFRDPMFREAILKHGEAKNVLDTMHGLCADLIEPSPESTDAQALARYGRHLSQAGRPHEALRPFVRAATLQLATGEARVANGLLSSFTDAASHVHLQTDEPVVLEALSLLGRIAVANPDLRTAGPELRAQALEGARRIGYRMCIAELLAASALHEMFYGSLQNARELAHAALPHRDAFDDPFRELIAFMSVADVLSCCGQASAAQVILEDIVARIDRQHTDVLFWACIAGAEFAMNGGLHDDAQNWIRTATDLLRRTSARRGSLALIETIYADLQDDHEAVVQAARLTLSEASFSARHLRRAIRVLLRLSTVRHDPSAVSVEELEASANESSPVMVEHARCRIAQCILSLARGDAPGATRYLGLAAPASNSGKLIFSLARDAAEAARRGAELGYLAIATELAMLAVRQYRGLGKHDEAADLERFFRDCAPTSDA